MAFRNFISLLGQTVFFFFWYSGHRRPGRNLEIAFLEQKNTVLIHVRETEIPERESFILAVSVHKFSGRLHEDLQPDLHDAADRSLERLPPVPGAHAPGLSLQLLGCHQRTAGEMLPPI